MPDPIAVANKRAVAEVRLARAASAASKAFGINFKTPTTPANRYPDLAAAELVENVGEFLEQITATRKDKP